MVNKNSATTTARASDSSGSASNTTWLSSNDMKAAGERFFLWYAVAWIAFMAVIVGTRAFEWFTPMQYLWVGVIIFVPCICLPILFPSKEERNVPVLQRYTFKNNVWVFIVTFYALWVWQIYFYKVLCTYYSFSEGVLRINNVPITLFLITQGYFSLYHTLSDIVLRAYFRRFRSAPWLFFVIFLLAFCALVAFMETFTIQNFPHYVIFDRWAMYTYGSAFYALYFIFTFPMHFRLDETPRESVSLEQTVINAFAACGMVTLALEMWRVSIGSIVSNCPYTEAHASNIPFIG